jgi:hypothetical protein
MSNVSNTYIHEFDFIPKFKKRILLGEFPKNLTFGFELEVDSLIEDPIRQELSDITDKFVYFKYDGSCAMEVNSHPFNWNWYIKNDDIIKKITDLIIKDGTKASRDCGFHIHFDMKYFTIPHINRLLYFINKYHRFMKKVSQRKEFYYTQFHFINPDEKKDNLSLYNCFREEKYSAINLVHENTIEFRIFQGTVNYRLIKGYLEFCMALILYTKDNKINELSLGKFRSFIRNNKRLFSNASKMIKYKNRRSTPLYYWCRKAKS